MTAVAKLPEKWREDDDCSALEYAERLRCADELEAALSPAELGGVEYGWAVEIAPENVVFCKAEATARAQAFELRRAGYPCTITPLYASTPRAAEAVAVDDPMIYRFRFAYEGCPIQPSEHERVRIALTASLTPPSAKGE